MDPKAQFMEQLKQREEQDAAGKIQQQRDIEEFQNRMSELASQIQSWLNDVPSVQVNVTSMTLFDDTLVGRPNNNGYLIDCITISANGRTLRFKPSALYLLGAAGLVEMEFTGVRPAPQCKLYMQSSRNLDGAWTLETAIGRGRVKTREPAVCRATVATALSRLPVVFVYD